MQLRGTLLQPWHYFSAAQDEQGDALYQRLARDAQQLSDLGITAVWLPPASAGVGGADDVGYGVKDWYQLDGTKYGDKADLQTACATLNDAGIEVYHDQVHNHLMGGEMEHGVWCLHVQCNNKNQPLDDSRVWFQADIPSAYPWLKLSHQHFDAYHPNGHDCWAITGKSFDREAKMDPLMGCDLDFDNIDLVKKLEAFGLWFKHQIPVDGYRFDAVKHIRPKATLNFLTAMRRSESRRLFAVAEYFDSNIEELHRYIEQTHGQMSLFDFPLQRKLVEASRQGDSFSMASLLNGTLCRERPLLAVTFVHSHDDQPGMNGEGHRGEYVGDWFIGQAYAMILLRDEGYPMVSDVDMQRHGELLRRLLLARHDCAWGSRHDRFDHANTVGWAFSGGYGYDNSMAVVMTNGQHGWKWLPTYRSNTRYVDLTGALTQTISTNDYGWAEFECADGSVSVWVEESKYRYLMDRLAGH